MLVDRHVRLACPPPPQQRGSAPAAAAERLEMCSWLYVVARRGRAEEVLALLLQQRHAAPPAPGVIQHGQCDILEETAESNTVLHVAAEQGVSNQIAKQSQTTDHCKGRNEFRTLEQINRSAEPPPSGCSSISFLPNPSVFHRFIYSELTMTCGTPGYTAHIGPQTHTSASQ